MNWLVLLVITVSADVTDRRSQVYCRVTTGPDAERITLEDGKSYPRTAEIKGPYQTIRIVGHNHLPPGMDRGPFTDLATDLKSTNEVFLTSLKSLNERGDISIKHRYPDFKKLESGGMPGSLFVEETPDQAKVLIEDLKIEYLLFKANMERRGLLPGHQDLFDRLSSLFYGEAFLYKYRNQTANLFPVGDSVLFEKAKNALDVRNSGVAGLKTLASQGRVDKRTLDKFNEGLIGLGYSGISDTELAKADRDAEALLRLFDDPVARDLAYRAIDGELRFRQINFDRDVEMANEMTRDSRSYAPTRTLFLGAFHVSRLSKLIEKKCVESVKKLNREQSDMFNRLKVDPSKWEKSLFRTGDDGAR